jgi:hypothetical protein
MMAADLGIGAHAMQTVLETHVRRPIAPNGSHDADYYSLFPQPAKGDHRAPVDQGQRYLRG